MFHLQASFQTEYKNENKDKQRTHGDTVTRCCHGHQQAWVCVKCVCRGYRSVGVAEVVEGAEAAAVGQELLQEEGREEVHQPTLIGDPLPAAAQCERTSRALHYRSVWDTLRDTPVDVSLVVVSTVLSHQTF